ncbi:hypothetical protein [Candidatus Electronema sp. PJ]|uniref:hypothetical protein n=1 Tax=Candidatus Electronema sp. PJ TaxID=3401572 RepID=UPI003AA878E4
MTKLTACTTLLAVAVLSGCQPCSNCSSEYEYETSSPTTIYKYTSYPSSSSDYTVESDDTSWSSSSSTYTEQVDDTSWLTIPSTSSYSYSYTPSYTSSSTLTYPSYSSYNSVPIIQSWPTYPTTSTSYYNNNNYSSSYYGGGYSGPRFSTPPMQPMPYPTEWYYPFKRPTSGVFVPGNRSYYSSSSYYSVPQISVPPTYYPRSMRYYP